MYRSSKLELFFFIDMNSLESSKLEVFFFIDMNSRLFIE